MPFFHSCYAEAPLRLTTIGLGHLGMPELVEAIIAVLLDLLGKQGLRSDLRAQLHVLGDDRTVHVQSFLPLYASDSRAACTTGLPASILHAVPGSSRQIGQATPRAR